MLPKKKRVTKDLFQNIIKTGRTISSPLFLFRYIPQKTPQYAFVAPKTVAKQAFLRNKLRRQGYSALRQNPKIPNVLGVFFYKKGSKEATFKTIRDDVSTVLTKIPL